MVKMNSTESSGVFLRGERDYVQGTQMIARAAECLEGSHWIFERAVFSQITRRDVSFSEPVGGAEHIGTLRFVSQRKEKREFRVFETETLAPRRYQDLTVKAARSNAGPGDPAIYSFAGVHQFEDMLNAIVIAIKTEHHIRFQGCQKVWLTGLRNLRLPVNEKMPGSGVVTIAMNREMRGNDVYQTLWRLDIADDAGNSISNGAATFSYEPRRVSNAD